MNVPWPAAEPNKLTSVEVIATFTRREVFASVVDTRYDYDVITDHDLDKNPEILKGYGTVLIHEY